MFVCVLKSRIDLPTPMSPKMLQYILQAHSITSTGRRRSSRNGATQLQNSSDRSHTTSHHATLQPIRYADTVVRINASTMIC